MKKNEPSPSGPTGESRAKLKARVARIVRALLAAYQDARIPLNWKNELELLIATILSAQCTDKKVNELTKVLFKKYKTASDWASAPIEQLEEDVHPAGFFRSKARSIKESTRDLVDRYGGRVPDGIEELTSLRGIGRKTANVILAHAFGKQTIAVDTHVTRLSRRMGLTAELDATRIEFELMELVPKKHWSAFALAMILHGREICRARKALCDDCLVSRYCPASDSRGEITWKVKSAPAPKSQ